MQRGTPDPNYPDFDPEPVELAGEGVIQPSGGALELAFDLPMPSVPLVEFAPN